MQKRYNSTAPLSYFDRVSNVIVMERGEHITRTFKILDYPRCPWCGAGYDETPEHPHPFVKGEAGGNGEFCKNCGKWGEFKHIPFGKAIIITGVMMLYGYVVYSLETTLMGL